MPCYSPLKGFKSRLNGGLTFRREEAAGEKMEVACGQCLGCRLDYSRVWAIRIMHEAQSHDDNCFVTLTYRSEKEATEWQKDNGYFMPSDGSLKKTHVQKFIRSVRRAGHKVRYYYVGEYGDVNWRPHYHLCLFGWRPADLQPVVSKASYTLYDSEQMRGYWPYGFSQIGELNYDTAAYTARYVLKKQNGAKADDHYQRFDPETGEIYWLEREFARMSLKPGIGYDWFQKYKADCFPRDITPVPGKQPMHGVPRYYEQIFQAENGAESIEEVKKLRQRFRKEHGEEYSPERLFDKYKVKKAQIKQLKREV